MTEQEAPISGLAIGRPAARRGLRLALWLAFAGWLLFVVLVTALRYAVLPNIARYQPEIERAASQALGQTVTIGRLEARWQGLHPDLVLNDVRLADRDGKPTFSLSQVETVLSWQTLWRGRLHLSLLAVEGPVLQVRRDEQGQLSVAGMSAEGESDPAALEWLLAQSHIRIRNATIVWQDDLRQAPPLVLEDLQFGLDNSGRRHRFGLSAAPPAELAARLDVRGEIVGDLRDALESFAGRVFVELDYADLAGWRRWLDYPVNLPRGRGALRLWGDLDEGEGKLTADVALEDLKIRLGRDLPELDLASMRGRLSGRYQRDEWEVGGHKVELQTSEGVRLVPTDFNLAWRERSRSGEREGELTANFIDLAVLRQMAGYLPLDAESRQLLETHQPAGRLSEIRAKWQMKDERLTRYSARAIFRELGLRAAGKVPGVQGLSGTVDATEKGGTLTLASGAAQLSLPAIFPVPDIALDSIDARATWRLDATGGLDVNLDKLDVSAPDAAFVARGSYHRGDDGPGSIDLSANISRADGTAVWRYMPHVVNANARNWLHRAITAGRASEGRFVLKGNLRDFPFRDPATGTFYVTAKAHGARLEYADNWPIINDIDGDMRFGVGMSIKAHKGDILGVALSDVVAEIPDFDVQDEILTVRGVARGPTANFLSFIEKSPVSQKIDRFTEGMKASGPGRLDLGLHLPLSRLDDSKVKGDFQFTNNTVQPLPGLPPITRVNGRLAITEGSILADEISGNLLGGAMKLKVKNEGERVLVRATGQATAAALRDHFGWPLLDQLGGGAGWKTEIGIRKRSADFTIESNLVGLSSALPEPLNKSANTPLPLRIERTAPDATREQFRVSLGKQLRALFVQRQEGAASTLEKAALVVGEGDLRLPDKGINVLLAMPRVDGDAWRAVLPTGGGKADGGGAAGNLQLQIKTPSLYLFGREQHNVDASIRPREGGYAIGLNMREAQGELLWRSAGDGLLEGRLKRLIIQPSAASEAGSSQLLDSLPGMNLTVDDLYLGELALGQLDIRARNEKGIWHLENLALKNPDASLKGKGSWQKAAARSGRQATRLDFELAVNDIGRTLNRLGQDDAVRRGKARLTGDLQWDGGLTAIDYPTLTGNVAVQAEKGQFNKLEPGIGKLLGLISLQSLPRRLTLDFRDIFSDGLAFDSIDGKLVVNKGIMRTVEPLRIRGPAAQIEMKGETDLKAETQDLQVVVRPEISTVAAVGAALINPIAGAATLIGSTVLDSPFNRLFSYRYHVTGKWSDPKVDKTGETVPPAAPKAGSESK